jgi:hypothetical protein
MRSSASAGAVKSDAPVAMRLPVWRLHPFKGQLAGHWAVWVDKNWRLTSSFSGPHAIDVDYQDDHQAGDWQCQCMIPLIQVKSCATAYSGTVASQ